MDNKPLANLQRAEAKLAQDEEDERIRKLEAKAPTTRTTMGDGKLDFSALKKGYEKFKGLIFPESPPQKKAKGGVVKMAKGGFVSSADGAAKRGKTKGRRV